LSQQFASHGLQFFKVNKTVTHVSVARPQYLDIESNPVSDGIRRIVEYINSNAKCTRKKLVEALAPTPKTVAVPLAEKPVTAAPVAPVAEGAAAPAPAKPAEPKAPEPTPEQTAVMVDLHWLIHQGAVLEFADGRMETAKKPLVKPPRPEKKEVKPAEGQTAAAPETAAATEVAPAPEVAPAAEAAVTTETAPAAEVAAPVAEPVVESAVAAPEAAPAPTPAPEAVAPAPETPATSEPAPAA